MKKLEITSVKKETHDVKTFRLKTKEKIKFVPGQYTLVLIPDLKEFAGETRPLTFASSPTQNFVEFTVKRMGAFTTAMHDLGTGQTLGIEEPRGSALNFDETVKEDAVFIAGGSGITPFISALRYAQAKKMKNRLVLLNSNKTTRDIIFKKELEKLNALPTIQAYNTVTNEIPEKWSEETGFIDREKIERLVPNPGEKIWYVCGPPPMTKAMEKILREIGVEEEKIRVENWQIPGKGDAEKESKQEEDKKDGKDMGKKFGKCKVCGDIHFGDAWPEICPTCKAENAYETIEAEKAKEEMRL
ncbi:MAG: hypothetical protein JW772_04515 [Candidatus Diapherotrites archaeon]|nr:hypothetical protein [Candidatus Diapherotrites archaeon]